MAHSVIGSNPQIAPAVLHQCTNAEITEAVGHPVTGYLAVVPPIDALVGPNPDATVVTLEESTDKIVGQAGSRGVVNLAAGFRSKCSMTVCADPQSA